MGLAEAAGGQHTWAAPISITALKVGQMEEETTEEPRSKKAKMGLTLDFCRNLQFLPNTWGLRGPSLGTGPGVIKLVFCL